MQRNVLEGLQNCSGRGGLVWFGLVCPAVSGRRQPLTFPVKGLGSGQQPALTRGQLVHQGGGWQLCLPPLSLPFAFPWCSCPLC